jgi:hypothetical protein
MNQVQIVIYTQAYQYGIISTIDNRYIRNV